MLRHISKRNDNFRLTTYISVFLYVDAICFLYNSTFLLLVYYVHVVIIINNNETNLPKIEMSKCQTVFLCEKSFGEDPTTIFFGYF